MDKSSWEIKELGGNIKRIIRINRTRLWGNKRLFNKKCRRIF